jgi:PAS domain S-box-containing protein
MIPATAPGVTGAAPVRVLIVDDDAVDRLAVRRALASGGMEAEVVEVDSGEAALAALADLPPPQRFDVILMDNLLPDYDGLQMLAHFHGAGITTPVIMMTGQGSEQLAVDLMKAGAADYLSKVSVSTEHLSRSIRNAIRVHRAEQATRAAEAEVRRGEEQYRFLAEAIPQIVWTARPDGGIDYFNGVWTRYSGQTIAMGGGAGWIDAVHPDDRQGVIARWDHSLRSGEPYEIEFRLRRLDGAYRWHLVRATPMRDASDAIVRWFGTCTDVHDWRHAQESLRIQRERLKLVVEAAALGLWYCDLPFDELDWDAKCKEHFHLPADARVTVDVFFSRVHPDDRERTRQAIDAAIADGAPYDIDFRTVSDDGDVKWIRAIGRCVFNPSGEPARFDGITVDVTAQKESEQVLRQAKDAAEAANNAKDRFLAVLSHELRTPLMPVLTEVQSLEMESTLGPDVRESLGVIRRNVELEARLIDDLLDLTRISKGKLQLNFETVDLHAAIRSAMDICSADVVGKRLTTSVDLSAGKHHVRADPARLQQVFWNLIKNAIKFTPTGGHITIHSYDDACGATTVTVTDNGIGIEPDALARIFDAFEQADESVTRQFGGLGLGLAISKALIGLHGGKLRASSAGPGQGSTFTVELRPCRAVEEALPEQAPTQAARAHADVTILLVDDHQDTNRAMARLLERMGYNVRTADSIRAALDAADAAHFDLLISDIGLPDGSGLELMRQLLARHASIKGIALSGFGMEEDVKKSKEAGFYDHLIKPINFSRLETAIRDLTRQS